MKSKFIAVFILAAAFITVKAQTSWVQELPMRGMPVKMIPTNDGGYALLAQTDFIDNFYCKTSVIKYDNDGNFQWAKTYSQIDSTQNFPKDIVQTQDDDYIIVGQLKINTTNYGFYLKLNSFGDTICFNLYNLSNYFSFRNSLLINNNNYVLGGDYYSYSYFHIFDETSNLLYIDSNEVFYNDIFPIFSKININKILICKISNTNYSTYIYTDTLLNHLLEKNYLLKGYYLSQTLDNGFVFLNSSNYLFKINFLLDSIWYRPSNDFTISGYNSQIGKAITSTNDNGIAFCGNISNPFVEGIYIIKTDSLGIKEWTKNYAFLYSFSNVVSIIQAPDSGYVMFVSGFPGGVPDSTVTKMWLVKFRADGTLDMKNTKTDTFAVDVYPNPVTNELNFNFQKEFTGSIELFSIEGALLHKSEINLQTKHTMQTAGIKAGAYILRFTGKEGKIITTKIIKIDY